MHHEKQLQRTPRPTGKLTPGLLWSLMKWPSQNGHLGALSHGKNPHTAGSTFTCRPRTQCMRAAATHLAACPPWRTPSPLARPRAQSAGVFWDHPHPATPSCFGQDWKVKIGRKAWMPLQASSNTKLPAGTRVRLQRHTSSETCLAEPPPLLAAAGARPPDEAPSSQCCQQLKKKKLQPASFRSEVAPPACKLFQM